MSELLTDWRFTDLATRREHEAEPLLQLATAFRRRTTDEWIAERAVAGDLAGQDAGHVAERPLQDAQRPRVDRRLVGQVGGHGVDAPVGPVNRRGPAAGGDIEIGVDRPTVSVVSPATMTPARSRTVRTRAARWSGGALGESEPTDVNQSCSVPVTDRARHATHHLGCYARDHETTLGGD